MIFIVELRWICDSQRYTEALPGYSQTLQTLPQYMTAQVLCFRDMTFCNDFFKNFRKPRLKKFLIPSRVVVCCQSTTRSCESCFQI